MVQSSSGIKLLAAGCVYGALTSVFVRADAMAPMGSEVGYYDSEYAYPYDEQVEEPMYDVFEPPEEAPEEAPEEEPMELDEPDEYVDMMAPEEAEEELDGETAAEPDPDVMKALGYDIVQDIDYIPGPGKAAAVADVDAAVVATAEECAALCDANPGCNIAAYFTAEFPGGMNCFLKGLSPGCAIPADTDPVENGWLMVSDSKCDVEVEAPVPTAVVTGTYIRAEGKDYIPSSITGGPMNAVTIEDIGEGLLVDTIDDCEAACDAEVMCNTASYYNEIIADTGKNCYLKKLGDSCAVPSDAASNPLAILSLKCATAVPPAAAVAPAATTLPVAEAPIAVGAPTAPTAPTVASRGPTNDEATVSPPDADTGIAVCTSAAAVMVAGVVALL